MGILQKQIHKPTGGRLDDYGYTATFSILHILKSAYAINNVKWEGIVSFSKDKS